MKHHNPCTQACNVHMHKNLYTDTQQFYVSIYVLFFCLVIIFFFAEWRSQYIPVGSSTLSILYIFFFPSAYVYLCMGMMCIYFFFLWFEKSKTQNLYKLCVYIYVPLLLLLLLFFFFVILGSSTGLSVVFSRCSFSLVAGVLMMDRYNLVFLSS